MHSTSEEIKTRIYTFLHVSDVDAEESCFLMQNEKLFINMF